MSRAFLPAWRRAQLTFEKDEPEELDGRDIYQKVECLPCKKQPGSCARGRHCNGFEGVFLGTMPDDSIRSMVVRAAAQAISSPGLHIVYAGRDATWLIAAVLNDVMEKLPPGLRGCLDVRPGGDVAFHVEQAS